MDTMDTLGKAVSLMSGVQTTTEEVVDFTTEAAVDLPEGHQTFSACLVGVIMIFSLVGNILAFSSIMSNRSNMYPWFLNLSLSDVIKTLFCMPYSIYILKSDWWQQADGFENENFGCQFFGYVFHLTLLMGLISNMCVALDRVHATYFPFHYNNNQARWPVKYLMLLVWSIVAAVAAIPFAFTFTGAHTGKPVFKMQEYMPICLFDFREVEDIRNMSQPGFHATIAVYYFFLYGLPIVIIITSTCLVMRKLLPRILAERKLHSNANHAVIISNASAKEDHMLTTIATAVSEENLPSAVQEKRNRKTSNFNIDYLLKLHTSNKQKNRKSNMKRNQWRAIQTMMIVSVAFLLCHMTHFAYWALYDTTLRSLYEADDIRGKYGILITTLLSYLRTGQIVLVYLDSAINVVVYYSRCTMIKESMIDNFRQLFTILVSPLFKLMSSRR